MIDKKRLLTLTLTVIVITLMNFLTPLPVRATDKTFHSGALLIPMDSVYQPDADGGTLEAYGFIFELLSNNITIYWIIDEAKTSVSAVDVTIFDANTDPVASYWNHDGTTSALINPPYPSTITTSISYSGGPFVIVYSDEAAVKTIIANTASNWSAVDVHKINVAFTANVIREMSGTPPKIALMNNGEDKTSGNAQILESYVRLAGICSTTYAIVTPNEIRDGILVSGGYDLLWAPHWTGYESYATDVETIVTNISNFLDNGKSLFAECASIEVFEHSANGKFLSTNGFGHNGVNKAPFSQYPNGLIVYNDPTSPFSQIADFTYGPTGGHLHNWRPFQAGDPYSSKLFTPPATSSTPPATPPNSVYENSVSRFTFFDIDADTNTTNDQWDYYVGGRKDGDSNKGYVVYLGGHKYASCSGSGSASVTPGEHYFTFQFAENVAASSTGTYKFEFEFKQDIKDEVFEFIFYYSDGSSETVSNISKLVHTANSGSPVAYDFTNASFADSGGDAKKIKDVYFVNSGGSDVTLTDIKISWVAGASTHADQKSKKIKEKDVENVTLFDEGSGVANGTKMNLYSDLTIVSSGGVSATPEVFTFAFHYPGGITTATPISGASHAVQVGAVLQADFTNATFSGNQIQNVKLTNLDSSDLTLKSVDISWTDGEITQRISIITDTTLDVIIWNTATATPAVMDTTDVTIESSTNTPSVNCTNNSDCTPTNIAAVRYVLNTLFNLQYTVVSKEFIRSTPVVSKKVLYQGTFEYPSYKGHFKAYIISNDPNTNGNEKWDAAEHIPADASRKIFTYINGANVEFTTANINLLRASLNVTPTGGDDTDELDVIKRVRGLVKTNNAWVDTSSNKLGGIEHSSSAVVTPNDKTNANRKTVAYVGDLYGMLHAFDVNDNGKELWAFIPGNILGKLKNDRTDPLAANDFAAVDSPPTVRDVFIDVTNDNTDNPEWRTIITLSEGDGGNSVFALDVTNPDTWSTVNVLWENTVASSGSGVAHLSGMGHGFRTTISKIKDGGIKYSVITTTNYANPGTDPNTAIGGIQIYSYDLESGALNWNFSADYSSSINDVPGALGSYDITGDSFADMVIFGDMEGRLWELNIIDGTNPNDYTPSGTTTPNVYLKTGNNGSHIDKTSSDNMPLYNAGSGQPIAASPSVMKINNHIVAIFGTGGTDWADNNGTYSVIGVDITDKQVNPVYSATEPSTGGAGTRIFKIDLNTGEKVWSAPSIAAGKLYFATAFGTLEGADPSEGVRATGVAGTPTGNIHAYDISLSGANQSWKQEDIGQVRSSIFIADEQLYGSTLSGGVVQMGSGTTGNPLSGGQVRSISWKDTDVIE